MKSYLSKKQLPAFVLSLGLAFVFIYAGVASLLHPLEWIGYLPHFLGDFVSLELAIKLIAVYEIILGVVLISGKFRKIAAALTALTLAGIIFADLSQFAVTFRDVGLLFAAAALFLLDDEQ